VAIQTQGGYSTFWVQMAQTLNVLLKEFLNVEPLLK
jgi:hypothetical protein